MHTCVQPIAAHNLIVPLGSYVEFESMDHLPTHTHALDSDSGEEMKDLPIAKWFTGMIYIHTYIHIYIHIYILTFIY